MLKFGEFEPDKSNYQGSTSQLTLNVVPRADGWGPWKAFASLTSTLNTQARGVFYARKTDGSVRVFAGLSANLWLLDNTTLTWGLVGNYASLPTGYHWQFAQFGNLVIAVQPNVVPQVYDLTAGGAFTALGGSPPQAAYIAVVGRFLVLTGLTSLPFRIQWSGLNAITTWTSGVNSSDFQDFPDGGVARGVAGGEYGVVFQDSVIRSMIYAVGSAYVFAFVRIAEDKGLLAPYSIIRAGSNVFFLAAQGFHVIVGSTAAPIPIGKEKVDRYFFANYDQAQLQLILGAADPQQSRVYWPYKSQSGTTGFFDKILCFDYSPQMQRWALIDQIGSYLASLAAPSTTLEGLDLIAPGIITISGAISGTAGRVRLTISGLTAGTPPSNTDLNVANRVEVYGVVGTTEANGNFAFTIIDATHIELTGTTFANAYVSGGSIGGALDQLTFSLDDVTLSALPKLLCVDINHKLGFFSGANVEATLDTAEQRITGKRSRIQGSYPVTDAPTIYGSVGYRETMQGTVTYSTEQLITSQGICWADVSTPLARFRGRIPAGTVWTYASGFDPMFVEDGTT